MNLGTAVRSRLQRLAFSDDDDADVEAHVRFQEADPDQPAPDLALATVLSDVIRNQRRRTAFRELVADAPLTKAELAVRVATAELDQPTDTLTSAGRKRVYTALHQSHLPKLEEYDLIDQTADGYVVADTADARAVADLIETIYTDWEGPIRD